MKKIGLIGAGKMGISHLSILGAHPDVEVVGVAETSTIVSDVLKRYTSFDVYSDYTQLISEKKPDAVFVSVPTKYHEPIVQHLLDHHINVFVEKPFSLNTINGKKLVQEAMQKNICNQVGYHNKFIGTFMEAKRIIDAGSLGHIQYFIGNMNGPVVTKRKEQTWRSKPEEGGGCLMDYAAHLIDLINHIVSPITTVHGADLLSFYSASVEDAVSCLLETQNRIHGTILVNWSDETYRKMSTCLTILGTKGKLIVDSTELKVFFQEPNPFENYSKGWNVKHINELSPHVDFYLRGEEYSLQIDHFIRVLQGRLPNSINTFETALQTDIVIQQIRLHKTQRR